jgi:hypothetical protein
MTLCPRTATQVKRIQNLCLIEKYSRSWSIKGHKKTLPEQRFF